MSQLALKMFPLCDLVLLWSFQLSSHNNVDSALLLCVFLLLP